MNAKTKSFKLTDYKKPREWHGKFKVVLSEDDAHKEKKTEIEKMIFSDIYTEKHVPAPSSTCWVTWFVPKGKQIREGYCFSPAVTVIPLI